MSITHKKLFKSPIAIGVFLSMNFSSYDCGIKSLNLCFNFYFVSLWQKTDLKHD